MKVAMFTSGRMSLSTISFLHAKQLLAGVVLGVQKQNIAAQAEMDQYDRQFIAQLEQLGVCYSLFDSRNENNVIEQVFAWEANVGVILGFPNILAAPLLAAFDYGVYNVHASLLPKYRGAMPLYWQIRRGESHTAITLHKAETKVDCGNIVCQEIVPIHPRDTLYSLAAQVAARMPMVVEALLELIDDTHGIPLGEVQTGEGSLAPWPRPEETFVDWDSMCAEQISTLARAGNAAFGALLFVGQAPVSLLQATRVEHKTFAVPGGTVVHIGEPEGLIVATHDGAVRLDILSVAEGVFAGVAFAERFALDAGSVFKTPVQ